MTRTFDIDLKLGETAERDFAKVLKKRMKGLTHIQKVDYKKYPYDLRITFDGGRDKTVEVKSLAGGYPTVCVEVWADNKRTKRPQWFHSSVDIVAFQDRSRNKWFLYQAQEVIQFLKSYDGRLTRAKNGCKDDTGYIALFSWNGGVEGKSLPGFLTEVRGEDV